MSDTPKNHYVGPRGHREHYGHAEHSGHYGYHGRYRCPICDRKRAARKSPCGRCVRSMRKALRRSMRKGKHSGKRSRR